MENVQSGAGASQSIKLINSTRYYLCTICYISVNNNTYCYVLCIIINFIKSHLHTPVQVLHYSK